MEYVRLFSATSMIKDRNFRSKRAKAAAMQIVALSPFIDVLADFVVQYADYFELMPDMVPTRGILSTKWSFHPSGMKETTEQMIPGYVFTAFSELPNHHRAVYLVGLVTIWSNSNGGD